MGRLADETKTTEFLTVTQACQVLGISRPTFYVWRDAGKMDGVLMSPRPAGRGVFIDRASLEAWARGQA